MAHMSSLLWICCCIVSMRTQSLDFSPTSSEPTQDPTLEPVATSTLSWMTFEGFSSTDQSTTESTQATQVPSDSPSRTDNVDIESTQSTIESTQETESDESRSQDSSENGNQDSENVTSSQSNLSDDDFLTYIALLLLASICVMAVIIGLFLKRGKQKKEAEHDFNMASAVQERDSTARRSHLDAPKTGPTGSEDKSETVIDDVGDTTPVSHDPVEVVQPMRAEPYQNDEMLQQVIAMSIIEDGRRKSQHPSKEEDMMQHALALSLIDNRKKKSAAKQEPLVDVPLDTRDGNGEEEIVDDYKEEFDDDTDGDGNSDDEVLGTGDITVS